MELHGLLVVVVVHLNDTDLNSCECSIVKVGRVRKSTLHSRIDYTENLKATVLRGREEEEKEGLHLYQAGQNGGI